jgi:hypothetical protein
MSESAHDLVSDEALARNLCDLPDAPNPLQSPVSQSTMQEEIMTTTPEDMVVEPMQHTALRFPHSPQPVPDGSLLSLQLDLFSEASMFSSGSSFSMTPMSVYGLGGGIPDFYFGNDGPASTTFLMPEQGTIGSESSASLSGIGHPSVDSSSSQDYCIADDEDALVAEYVPHVPGVDERTRDHMINMLNAGMPQPEASHMAEAFPSLQYLDAYVQLFFEHFHRRWPVLHVPTFKMSPEMWQLVFSVAFIGCQFSEASQKHKHLRLFCQLSPQILNKTVGNSFPCDYDAILTTLRWEIA